MNSSRSETTFGIKLVGRIAVMMLLLSFSYGWVSYFGPINTTTDQPSIPSEVSSGSDQLGDSTIAVIADGTAQCSEYSTRISRSKLSSTQLNIYCDGNIVFGTDDVFYSSDFRVLRISENGTTNEIRSEELAPTSAIEQLMSDINHDGISEIFLQEVPDDRGRQTNAVLLLSSFFQQIVYTDYGDTLFLDCDGDGRLEFRTYDYGITFADMGSDGYRTGIEPPEVTVTSGGGRFSFSQKQRRHDTQTQLLQLGTELRRKSIGERGLPDDLSAEMVRLIYGGQGDKAFWLLDHVSQDLDRAHRLSFENEFVLSLINSADFFDPAMAFNGWSYRPGSCPEGADRTRFMRTDTESREPAN